MDTCHQHPHRLAHFPELPELSILASPGSFLCPIEIPWDLGHLASVCALWYVGNSSRSLPNGTVCKQDENLRVAHCWPPFGICFPKAGVKNADEAELKLLASQPLDITVHNVLDFPQLATLAALLSRLVCQKIQGRDSGKDPAPQ